MFKLKKTNHSSNETNCLNSSCKCKNQNNKHNIIHEHHKTNWFSIIFLSLLFLVLIIVNQKYEKIANLFYVLITLFGLYPIVKDAWNSAKSGLIFSVATLMTVSALGAIYIDAAQEAAAVIILFMIGESIEGHTTRNARREIQYLASLLPEKSTLILNNNEMKSILTQNIQLNDIVEIKPGERIPVDGNIVFGSSYLDESLINGESTPTLKQVGDHVIAGSISTDSLLHVQASSLGEDNTISKMLKLVESAQASKTKFMRTIEKFSQIYTPIVFLISALVAVIPPLIFASNWHDWIYKGLTILLIGCPCALIISTPSAIAAGLTKATKLGILIKNAAAFEKLAHIQKIAFDKTGTITTGKIKVTDIVTFENKQSMLDIALTIEESIKHPIAQAIKNYALKNNAKALPAKNIKNLAGVGTSIEIENKIAFVCSIQYAESQNYLNQDQLLNIKKLQKEGKIISLFVYDNKAIGFIALSDELKEDTLFALNELNKMNIKCIVLTGDNRLSAEAIAKELPIELKTELLPKDKLNFIIENSNSQKIAMVGDGINDAPAIAAAHIGIAMGSGTDIALDSAEIVISRNTVLSVVNAIILSKKTLAKIKQNIFVAVGLKLFFLLLTVFGGTKLWIAILADSGATVIVTLNAIGLLQYKEIKLRVKKD